ncbi:MAG TPA: MerR family transcriptional regulator [Chloroflexota bacterium]|nr:MerR family transcriptional regulator [Chloroflexota bacterium]
MDELLLPGEAARLLGLTPAGVKAIEARGQLRGFRTSGGYRLYQRTDIMALAERREQQRRERAGEQVGV